MQIHDVSDYITWAIPRPEFYVQDILPKQGVMLLYGNPKSQKVMVSSAHGFLYIIGGGVVRVQD